MFQEDYIELDAMALNLSVGILDREYEQRQTVELRLRLGLDLELCGESGDLNHSVNYADVLEQTQALAEGAHWRLLESLARAIALMLLRQGRIDWVEVVLKKPEVLQGRGVPSVRILRRLSERNFVVGPYPRSIVLFGGEDMTVLDVEAGKDEEFKAPPKSTVCVIDGEASVESSRLWRATSQGARFLVFVHPA